MYIRRREKAVWLFIIAKFINMDKKQRAEIKIIIKEQIAKTEEAIGQYENNSQPVAPENSIGRISRMDAINNKSVVEAALRTAKRKLKKLQLSLSKIEDPKFGICIRCKKDIPPKRLILMPESQYCVHCAS
jgi:DnaK suppressor protein